MCIALYSEMDPTCNSFMQQGILNFGLTVVRVRVQWVSGLKITASQQTTAVLIGGLTGQP